jgi:hypothetical protein
VPAGVVAAVAGLGDAVGTEGGEALGGDEFADPAALERLIQVVDDLAPFVAEVAVVFEADGPGHGTPEMRGRAWVRGLDESPLTVDFG